MCRLQKRLGWWNLRARLEECVVVRMRGCCSLGQLADMAARKTRVLVLLVLVFLLSCHSVPRPSHFVDDNRNNFFVCEISQLNIEGFWVPCLVFLLLRCYHSPRMLVDTCKYIDW